MRHRASFPHGSRTDRRATLRAVKSSYAPGADLWRGRRNRLLAEVAAASGGWLRGATGALHATLVGILLFAGLAAWRVVALLGLYATLAIAQRWLLSIARDSAQVERAFVGMNLAAQIVIAAIAALTGGLYSPALPGIILPSIMSVLVFGAQPRGLVLGGATAALLVGVAALPAEVTGPPLPAHIHGPAIIAALLGGLLILHHVFGTIATAASRIDAAMAAVVEERVSDAQAHARRLQIVGAKVAHELKNPLASIKALHQLVARRPDGPRTEERLAVIKSEIYRMENILREYLSFSRPLEDLDVQTIDLGAIVADVADVMSGRAEHGGVALIVDAAPTPTRGDPRRLKEALINLVANAIEATPRGGSVDLQLRAASEAITLDVCDTGRGMTPAELERIGTSFFTTREAGTGLGVVLAQGVIAQHGGELRYTSVPGRGTTATIRLPRRAAEVAA